MTEDQLLHDAAPYLYALHQRLAPHSKAAAAMYEHLQPERFAAISFARRRRRAALHREVETAPPLSPVEWRQLGALLRKYATRETAPSSMRQNILTLARALALEDDATQYALCLLTALTNVVLFSVWEGVRRAETRFDHVEILSLMLNRPREQSLHYLRRSSPLVQNGLLQIHPLMPIVSYPTGHTTQDLDDCINIPGFLHKLLEDDVLDEATLRARVIGETATSDLQWSDFEHLATDRDMLLNVLCGAHKARAAGVNLLVYGPPGTGKTELCKVVAARAKLALHQVGTENAEGEREAQRLAPLLFASKLLSHENRGVFLFDEMEDILPAQSPFQMFGVRVANTTGEKLFLNRLLERNPLPTFWTCNEIAGFDPALLRRMTLAVEVNQPPVRVRERVWKRAFAQNNVRLPEADVRELAEDIVAAPALVASAARAAKFAGGHASSARHAVHALAKAVNHGVPPRPPQRAPRNYEPALLRLAGGEDAVALLAKLGRQRAQPLSICISGAPGTGKSAFARALAERMGLPVVQKRASDLLSEYVGGSEKRIARAFAEAVATRSFLIFDEADSLLRDRHHARHSWEITQVNEMLTWMETHPLPFACTTNLMELLDAATLRRFTLKLRALPLDAARSARCFRHFYGLAPPPELAELTTLTPGDFALVQQQARMFGEADDARALLARLRAECEAKLANPAVAGGQCA